MISVFRKTGDGESVVCRLSDRNAKLTQECMGKDEVSVQVTVDEVLPIREMDYIRVDGAVYTLNRMTDYDEVSDVEFRYNLIFEGVIYNLMDKMYVDVERNSDRFSLTGTLQEFTDLLVVNMNSVDVGWSRGDVPETERKNLTFESVSCREVLNRLASEFGVEYYLNGRKVCFTDRFENRTSLVFERGKGKGLYKLTCRNADTGNTVTRVRVYGSTENLPVGYRNGQADRLQLPMADGKPTYYLEDYSEFSKVVERTVHFDDVKPTFKGEVKTVSDEYNRRITCPAIDFDLKEVAVGDNARVNFLTGDLAGVAFRFEWDQTKKELNLIRQEDQMELPDADGKRLLIPNANKKAVAGDEFNFTGINLPQAYVDRAEQELLAKGREWLSFYKQLRVNFSLDVDYRFLRDSGYTLHVGDVVTVKVPKLGMEKMLRVLSVDKDLNTGKLSCNVSNYLTESWEKKIEGQIQATQSSVDRVNLNASYLVEATKEWVAQRFARLAGGNRFVGKQEVDGDVELAADRRLSIGDAVMRVAKGLFRTVLSVAGKNGEDVEIEAAGMKAKQVTAEEVSTPDFVSGFLGSGARLKDSHLELDELTVRKRMNVYELMIEKVKSVGGNLIVSVGSAKIETVADAGGYFRCTYQHNEAGTVNPFVVDDQVLCQTFGGKNARRYWRRVVAVGDGYFDLSKADCEAGSAVPEAGDEVVQLGHRTDRSRQSAILLCAVGADAPYTDHYDGINGFSLAGKLVSREGKLTGIVDEAFGQLSGSGLYAKNAYLRGSLALSTGQKVEERISELGREQILQKETLTELKADQDGFSVRVSSVEERATAAEEAVNGLQIGGVNLVSNLPENWINGVISGSGIIVNNMTYLVTKNFTSIDAGVHIVSVPDYVCNVGIVLFRENKAISRVILVKGTEYESREINVLSTEQFFKMSFRFEPAITVSGNDILRAKIQIEKGNLPTTWSPSLADQQAMIDSVQIGTRNYISKKYLLDWNRTDKDIAVWGKDGEGVYLSIDHKKLHDCVALADGFEQSADVFGNRIAYKPNTQYVFCVDWKLTAAQSHVGIDFLIWYSDCSYSEVNLERDCLTRRRTNVITDQGKSVVKISAAYGVEGARSLIYDIGLVEGNRAPVNIPVAEEDLKGASHVNLVDGTKLVSLIDAGGDWNYRILNVPVLKPNTVYSVSFQQAEVLSGNPAGFSFVLYNKSITKARGSVTIPAGGKSGVLFTTNDFSAEDSYLLVYGGTVGATKGVSVKYSGIMLVEGFLAPDSWSQSVGDVSREINDVSDALKDLDSTITTTFKDGVIQAAEAKAIEQHINTLEAEKKDMDAQYSDLYGNAYVPEDAKQGLTDAKSKYNATHTALLAAIRAAIADGVTSAAEKADVDAKFSAYGSALAVYQGQAGKVQKAIQDELNRRASIEASNKALGQSWANGRMLYTDPTFKVGSNGVYPYNNSGNGTVIVTRVGRLADSPVRESDYNMEVKNTGTASPGVGGFRFGTAARANAILIARFIAKIPVGRHVLFATNSIGTGNESFWATPNAGTGKWTEYIFVVKCGSTGVFGDTMYFYLDGSVGTPSSPVVWYLAYASVFDVTDGRNAQTDARDAFLEANRGKLFLRGTGINRVSSAVCMINNDGVNLLSGVTQSGANLVIFRRSDLVVLERINYYCTWASDAIGQSKVDELVEKLNSLDSSVIVCLVSYDSMFGFADYTALFVALERCGASGSKAMNASIRIPYAFVGIPGIGKGNGIEVFTSSASDAPYAEISTQIVNGTPIGMSSVAAAAITVVKTELQTSIDSKSDRIELKAVENNYNALKERVSGAESKIEQTARQISLLVKDDTSESGIVIDPKRIEITGETVFRDTSNNQTFSIFSSGGYALNLNNNFKVTAGGKLYATNAEISGKIVSNSSGNRIVIDPDSRTFRMLSSGNYALFDLAFSSNTASMKISSTTDMAGYVNQVAIGASYVDITYATYGVSLGATSTTFKTLKMLIDLSAHTGQTTSPSLYIKGLQKVTNTNGWDRVLVNVSTGQIAYG